MNLAQVGFHLTSSALTPKLERVNPLEGFKRIFSWKSVIETIKGLIKIGVISFVAYKGLRPAIDKILALSMSSSPDLIGMYLETALAVVVRALVVMVIVAVCVPTDVGVKVTVKSAVLVAATLNGPPGTAN